jgi:osmotically-inducible protein OsmY
MQRLLLILPLLLSLTGCATLVAPLSSHPEDTDHGSRTWGAFFEDAAIEHKVRVNLLRELPKDTNSHIVVVSFNGHLLLAGEVPSDSIKTQAGQIAKRIRHVQQVYNELVVQGNISMLARSNDAWLTTKVKLRLMLNGSAPGWRTKVVTENGVVYLMGLLTHAEAEQDVAQVQKVYGVQKIVKIVEYID